MQDRQGSRSPPQRSLHLTLFAQTTGTPQPRLASQGSPPSLGKNYSTKEESKSCPEELHLPHISKENLGGHLSPKQCQMDFSTGFSYKPGLTNQHSDPLLFLKNSPCSWNFVLPFAGDDSRKADDFKTLGDVIETQRDDTGSNSGMARRPSGIKSSPVGRKDDLRILSTSRVGGFRLPHGCMAQHPAFCLLYSFPEL